MAETQNVSEAARKFRYMITPRSYRNLPLEVPIREIKPLLAKVERLPDGQKKQLVTLIARNPALFASLLGPKLKHVARLLGPRLRLLGEKIDVVAFGRGAGVHVSHFTFGAGKNIGRFVEGASGFYPGFWRALPQHVRLSVPSPFEVRRAKRR